MLRRLMIGAVAVAVLLPAPAAAQGSGQIILYNRGHSKGASRTITGPRQHIEPAFVVKSLEISPGSAWELCSGSTFSGCRQVTKSIPSMVMTVRSVRPIAAILPASATLPGVGASGRSMRGYASEYFVTPDEGGNRVEVTPGTGEAMSRRAVEFCRARGWRSSAHERLQTVGGRVFLADVLCVNTGQ